MCHPVSRNICLEATRCSTTCFTYIWIIYPPSLHNNSQPQQQSARARPHPQIYARAPPWIVCVCGAEKDSRDLWHHNDLRHHEHGTPLREGSLIWNSRCYKIFSASHKASVRLWMGFVAVCCAYCAVICWISNAARTKGTRTPAAKRFIALMFVLPILSRCHFQLCHSSPKWRTCRSPRLILWFE